jgi:hypothetical protein
MDYYIVQLNALTAFEKYYKIAQELAQNIQAAKVDTTGVGPTSSSNYVLLQKQARILDKVRTGGNLIQGGEQIFWGGNNQVMVPGFTRYGLLGPINIFNKIFPSIGRVSKDGVFFFSILGNLKNDFARDKPSGVLTEKEAHIVDTQFIDYIASAFPFFNYSQSKDILMNVPGKLQDLKKKVSPDAPYKLFLDKLYVVEANAYSPIRRIEFYNTGKTAVENQRATYAWERMLQDSDPEVQQLALDLVKYTYFSNGYGFGPYSFANMVPVKFWSNEFQIANNIVDKQGNPFNVFLEKSLNSQKLERTESTWSSRFKNQFIRNNFEREGFVSTIKIDKSLKASEEGATGSQINNVATMEAYNSKGGVIETSRGALIINAKKNPLAVQVDYIKVYKTKRSEFRTWSEVVLYKKVVNIFDAKNPNDFDGKTGLDTVTFMPISKLGTSNFVLEYDFLGDIENSLLADIKNTPNPKVFGGTTGEKIANTMMSEEDVLRAMAAEEGGVIADDTTTLAPKETPDQPVPELGGLVEEAKKPTSKIDLGIDVAATEGGLFEDLDEQDWKDYSDIISKLGPEGIQKLGGELTKQQFLDADPAKRAMIIWQAKNCL